jgi:4-hydroxy-2-oxoheptanedioate aldolase
MAGRIGNSALQRLAAGDLSLGFGLRHVRTVDIAPMMKAAGMDWLFLDLEHGPMDLETVSQISVAALAAGIASIVRVPNGDYPLACRALEGGALGIVMPHVESAEEARELVRRLRFTPQGERGVGGMYPHFQYEPIAIGPMVDELNRATLLTVMLETAEAIGRADEIAAVPGIDVVMIGTNDLALAIGKPGDFGSAEIESAYRAVAAACTKHKKWMGSGGLNDIAHFRHYVGVGARFLLTGSDAGTLFAGARQRAEGLRQIAVPSTEAA